MIREAHNWHQPLSRDFGSWAGRRDWLYSCPLWADKDVYTHGYLWAKAILRKPVA